MVMRGSAARRMLGNPLGGVLQDAHRKARKPTRRTGRLDDAPPAEPVQEPLVLGAMAAGPALILVTVEEAMGDRAVLRAWTVDGLPAPAGTVLHVSATTGVLPTSVGVASAVDH